MYKQLSQVIVQVSPNTQGHADSTCTAHGLHFTHRMYKAYYDETMHCLWESMWIHKMIWCMTSPLMISEANKASWCPMWVTWNIHVTKYSNKKKVPLHIHWNTCLMEVTTFSDVIRAAQTFKCVTRMREKHSKMANYDNYGVTIKAIVNPHLRMHSIVLQKQLETNL